MADTKISALADVVTLAAGDKVAVADASDLTVSKSATMTEVDTFIRAGALGTTEITSLGAAAALAAADVFPVNQTATAKKSTLTQLVTFLQTLGMPRVKQLASQHSVASATATKVTSLDITLEAGTYTYQYTGLCRSAGTGVGPQFGVNFSGTAAVKSIGMRFWDATTAISAEVHIMDNVGIKTAGFVSGMCHNAYSTTSPNLGTTVGVTATGSDIPVIIEGMLLVTVSGDLQLYVGSEDTTAVTLEAGSSLVVIRTA